MRKKILGIFLGFLATVATSGIVQAATTVVIPADMNGWGFVEETPTGSGEMVAGPGATFYGNGSAKLVVNSTGGVILAKADYLGLRLDEITDLKYSTYRTSGGEALAVALQLNFDSDLTDANDSWQGRLVYEPYHTQTVSADLWQTWDTLNDAAGTASGNWWFSNGTLATNSGCSMATPCTWQEIKTAFPNGGVHNTLGAVNLKAGGGWTGGFDGNVDGLIINEDVYDFELSMPNPRSAEITSPEPSEVVSGMVEFAAYLSDDDADPVQWAVREGVCATTNNTVFGNVDGHTDVATMDSSDLSMQTFSFTGDMSAMTPGMYCFVYNPSEDSGESDIRETREFELVAPPVVDLVPTDKNQCKKDGWMSFSNPSFKNQGACVSYVQSNENAGKR